MSSPTPSPPTDPTDVSTHGALIGLNDATPDQLYVAAQSAAEYVCTVLTDDVISPVAKTAFEDDRGIPVTQVLPDNTENYDFERGEFDALVLPDERRVVNHSYRGRAITPNRLMRDVDAFEGILDDAEQLWTDTFGKFQRGITQPGHPGACPLTEHDLSEALTTIQDLYGKVVQSKALDVVIAAARDENTPVLADMFDTTEEEILTPGGTDLSAIPRTDEIHVPYNDGTIAVLRPTSERTAVNTPTRGVVIGHDDTDEPVGLFAHVIDVTNLSPEQETTHAAIRDAMGFDSELDPWDPVDRLELPPGERVRLQGDLRVERTGDPDEFPEELRRDALLREYRNRVDAILGGILLPENLVFRRSRRRRRQRSDVPVTDAVEPTVSTDGSVMLDPDTDDPNVELLAYVTALCELSIGPADKYDEYADIPYITEPRFARQSFARTSLQHALDQSRNELQEAIETALSRHRDEIEEVAREEAAEAEVSLVAPQQVNLPIDNHMTFVERGFSPGVDTEPVPVAVPEETTLHIVHGEHNTVTVQVDPGIYRFSLLPRGLQPPEDRPEWPAA